MSVTHALPPSLQHKLIGMARRVRRLRVVRGLSLLLLTLALMGAAALGADAWLDLAPEFRRIALVAWVGLGSAVFLFGVVLPLVRRLDPEALAALAEEKYPDLGERLTSSVELAGQGKLAHGSPALVALLLDETMDRASRLDLPRAVPGHTTGRLATLATLAFVLVVSPAWWWPERYEALGRRFLFSWDSPKKIIPFVLDVTPGDVVAAKGRALALAVRVGALLDEKVSLPPSCTLVRANPDGTVERLRMLADRPDAFAIQLDQVPGDFRYHVEAGDVSSDSFQVWAVDPVELAADGPTITITPPAYARAALGTQTVQGPVDLSALQYSAVAFGLHFTRPAVGAWLQWSTQAAGKMVETKTIPVDLSSDRASGRVSIPAMVPGSFQLVLEAEHGITTELEARTLTVQIDQPPAFVKVKGCEELQAIHPSDSLALKLDVADDVGVDTAEIEYRINQGSSSFEPIPLQGQGPRQAKGQYLFQLAGKVQEGDIVHLRLKAADNRRVPEANLGPNVAYYPAESQPGKPNWRTLHIARQAEPIKQQEIVAQRDDVNRRLEAIPRQLQEERVNLLKLRADALDQRVLKPGLVQDLEQVRRQNRGTETDLRDLARDLGEIAQLQPIADKAREVAEGEMRRSDKELAQAAKEDRAEPRDQKLQKAEKELAVAGHKLEALRAQNDRLAQARLDQMNLEALAARQDQLAARTAEQAQRDPIKDPHSRDKSAELQRAQNDLVGDLQRQADKSETLRSALEAAQADQARQLAQRARELAQAQRQLAHAAQDTAKQERLDQLTDLARRQHELAEEARRLAQETLPATKAAPAKPLQADDARKAADALKNGQADEALRRQDQTARELDRVAGDLQRAMDQARDRRQAVRQLARLQESLRQRLADEGKQPDPKESLAERIGKLRPSQQALQDAVHRLSLPQQNAEAHQERAQAAKRAGQAVEALAQHDPRQADARMIQARQALERLAERLPSPDDGKRQVQPELSPSPLALPNRSQVQEARRLAQKQRALKDAVQKAISPPPKDPAAARDNPLANLAREQEQIARRAADLARDLQPQEGKETPAARTADQAARSAQQAAGQLLAGALHRAHQAGQQTADQLRLLARKLAPASSADPPPKASDQAAGANDLVRKQEELNRRVEPLVDQTAHQRSQQQARQADLRQQTEDLTRNLNRLAQQVNRSPVGRMAAQQASASGQQAQAHMQQAQHQDRQGQSPQARQTQQQAASALARAAQQAEQAAQQAGDPRQPRPSSPGHQPTGQALRLAQGQMQQAQNQLAQSQNQSAQDSMRQAAQALKQATQQVASSQQPPGEPSARSRPGDQGAAAQGRPDPRLLGKDMKKYAGKSWGELSGELRTKIIQDMQAKYGDDYAQRIKLYFEQIADQK